MPDAPTADQQQAQSIFLRKRFEEDLRALLLNSAGRRVLHTFIRTGLIYHSIAVGAGMEFRMGQRELALAIRREISLIDPLLPAKMEMEWLIMEAEKPTADAPA